MADGDVDPLQAARMYLELERAHEALDALRHSDPTDAETYLLRGAALAQLRRFADSERECRSGLALEPENIALLAQLSGVELMRDAAAAEATLRKAIAFDPQNADLLGQYAVILMEQGRYEWAERMLARAMAIDAVRVQPIRTELLLRAAGSGEAREAAEELLRDNPDDAVAHYLQGLALLGAGRPVRGLRHLRQAAAMRPAEPLFAGVARALGAWYLWPSHVTNGVMHVVLIVIVASAGMAAAFHAGDIDVLWTVMPPWLGFVAYKWLAAGVTALRLRRMLRLSR